MLIEKDRRNEMENNPIVNPLSMNNALTYYNQFMDNYYLPHNYNGKLYKHSIPSSFVYNTVKDGCLWLLTLIVGVAGYSVYFDNDTETSKVLSLDLLNRAGVRDPALQYNSSIVPWEGVLSDGRSPMAPVDHVVNGLGIAYLNGSDLLPIYRADPLRAVLPSINPEDGKIIYDENGVMQVKRYTLCTSKEVVKGNENRSVSNSNRWVQRRNTRNTESENDNEQEIEIEYKPIYGWGMSYFNTTLEENNNVLSSDVQEKHLSLECVNDNLNAMCYTTNTMGIYCLKCTLPGKDIKCVGTSYGQPIGSTRFMSKLEFTSFKEYSKYHLSNIDDRFYIPLYWMSKCWSPFISWRNGKQTNSVQVIMMASSVYTFGTLSADSMQGKSVSAIVNNLLGLSLSQNDKDEYRRIITNTQRIISLVEFIKRA